MLIQEEMYKAIESEIQEAITSSKTSTEIDLSKVKAVAKMLTDLSVDKKDADVLVNQYISNIKKICTPKN